MQATGKTKKVHLPGTVPGSVYLLCADSSLGNDNHRARHYLGYARVLKARILSHATSHPDHTPKIVQAFNQRGIGWRVARVWTSEESPETPEGIDAPCLIERRNDITERFERKLKRRHNHRMLCPFCCAKPQPGYSR